MYREILIKPTIHTHTHTHIYTHTHTHIHTHTHQLKFVLETKLNEYNETNAIMSLVLFEQAIRHVTRITR
jgi:hypothetical protein